MNIARALTFALAVSAPLAAAHAQSDPLAPLRGLFTQGTAAVDQAAVRASRALTPRVPRHVARHAMRHVSVHRAAYHHVAHAAHHMVTHKVLVPARLKVVHGTTAVDQLKVAEKEGFKKVSDLTNGAFPPFYPSLGIVLVKPDTLPVGPYRCFDRDGHLVSSVYMLPLSDLDSHKQWDKVAGLPAPVDHATAYFHPGHPGVPVPHYHLVLWHTANEASVAK